MTTIDEIEDPPWNRYDWSGSLIGIGGCAASDFGRDDVDRVVAYANHGWDEDGDISAIVQLKDGRFAAWTTWEDVTGTGFSADAYGGTSDIYFASTVEAALSTFGEVSREALRGEMGR